MKLSNWNKSFIKSLINLKLEIGYPNTLNKSTYSNWHTSSYYKKMTSFAHIIRLIIGDVIYFYLFLPTLTIPLIIKMKSSILTGILYHVANSKVLLILQTDYSFTFSKLSRKNTSEPCNNNKTMIPVPDKQVWLGWRCCFISTWSQLVRWRSSNAQGDPEGRCAATFLVPSHTHGVQPSYSNARLSRLVASHIT